MRTTRPPTQPRKIPVQQRSRATVEAIVQAATYILARQGWEKLTTNAVAERAGVNISSLYQYFPNKQAIVAELERRHAQRTRQTLADTLSRLAHQRSLRSALTIVVQAMVDEHKVAPALHRAFAEELPRSMRCSPRERADPLMLEALRPFIRNVPDSGLAMQIATVAAHSVIHEAVLHRPELLDRPEFVQEVVALLAGYLRRRA